MFAVVRHPDVDNLGVVPEGALETLRTHGWYRVSEWRVQPSEFHLPDFAEAPDLDAPAPEPEKAPAKTTKESTQ